MTKGIFFSYFLISILAYYHHATSTYAQQVEVQLDEETSIPIISSDIAQFHAYPTKDKGLKALVIGASVSGLLSAQMLAKNGYDVLVIEKRRSYTRLNIVALTQVFYDVLHQQGINFETHEVAHPEKRWIIMEDFDNSKFPLYIPQQVGYEECRPSGESDFKFLISINKLEQMLNRAVMSTKHKKGHITLITGVTAELEKEPYSPNNSIFNVYANLRYQEDGQEKFRVLKDFNLVVGADGQNSSSRKQLDLETGTYPPRHHRLIFGQFHYPVEKEVYKLSVKKIGEKKTSKFERYEEFMQQVSLSLVLGSTKQQLYSAYMQVPLEEDNLSVEEMSNRLKQHMQNILPRMRMDELRPIPANPPASVLVQPTLVTNVTAGNNFVLIGDASGTDSPVAGYGMTATALKVLSLEILAKNFMYKGSPRKALHRSLALDRYEDDVFSINKRWMKHTNEVYQSSYQLSHGPLVKAQMKMIDFVFRLQHFFSK